MPTKRPDLDQRVLLLAPTLRDGSATSAVLAESNITCIVCPTLDQLCEQALLGASAVIVPEDVVLSDESERLAERLRQQPVWSDLPVIVLSRSGTESPAVEKAMATLGNVSLIERPMRVSTLLSVVRAALRARERQYQVRDHLEERARDERRLVRDAMLLSKVEDSVILTDLDGVVTFWNDGATRLFGFTAAEMIGRPYVDRLPAAARREVAVWIGRIASGGTEFEGEWLDERRDGTRVWIEASTRRITDAGGRPVGIMGVSRDITARKRAEAELNHAKDAAEQNLAQWHAVVESMTEGLVLADTRGTILSMNPAALAIHDFASNADMARRVDAYPGLFELRDLQGRHLTPDQWPIARVVRGERFSNCEVQVRRQDTGRTWIGSFSGTPARDAAGRIAVAVLTMRDVTEQKRGEAAIAESEKRFRHLAETIPQLAWMADADGAITWFNRRWYEYTGAPGELSTGWSWQGVHDPAHLPRVMEGWTRSVRTGEPFEMEFPIRRADGQFRWFLTRVAPLRDGDGRIVFWFGTNTDIEDSRRIADERAELLEAERTARVEAERAGRMKDEFLATLSHELRTPLNAILGWTQLLKAMPSSPQDLAEGLNTIERNARAQTQIIEDLLDMSRIISGKVRLDVKPMDLTAVLDFAVQTVRPAARAKGIVLECVVAPLDVAVSGDTNRLQQVFWNLLSNAVKFTPAGGRVRVVLRHDGTRVEIAVTDSGEGIRPEFLPHVFDRFRQADATTTRRHGGLGLGLAIVKQLVELHGGTIQADSAGANAGASFTVCIPLTPAREEHEPRPEPKPSPAGFHGEIDDAVCERLSGLRAIVVDDEPDSRVVVQRVLETCGLVVIPCASAAEAMQRIASDRPDLLVSDIGMPGEDGCSFLRRLRALAPDQGGDIPALALTAYARTEDRTRSLNAGFQAHLVKPIEPSALIAAVAELAATVKAARASPAHQLEF